MLLGEKCIDYALTHRLTHNFTQICMVHSCSYCL